MKQYDITLNSSLGGHYNEKTNSILVFGVQWAHFLCECIDETYGDSKN